MKKRILSALLCLCMVLTFLPTTALAVDEIILPETTFEFEGVGRIEDVQQGMQAWSIRPSAATTLLYDQLDEDSQYVYDTLKAVYENGPTGEYISLPELQIDAFDTSTLIMIGSSCALSEEDSNRARSIVRDATTPAFVALVYDHPEMSWILGVGWGTSISYSVTNISYYPVSGNYYSATIQPKNIKFYVASTETNTGTKADIDNAIANAKTTLSGAPYSITANTSRYEKAKAIHNYICNIVDYENDENKYDLRQYQTPYSVFYDCDGDGVNETVCAGYSKAYKLLCQEYDIPCILVSGTGNGGPHMWDYVQMEDGKWYAVDCTWDDQSQIFYDYFLSGGTTVATHFGTKTFNQSHVASGELSGGYTFAYPTLNATVYVLNAHVHTWDSGVITEPASCTEKGVKTYTCTGCGTTKTEEIETTEHSYVNTVIAPTCTEDGYTLHICSICGGNYGDTFIDALGHNLTVHNRVEAACTTAGSSAYWSCSRCGKYYLEKSAVHEIAEDSWIIPAKNHTVVTDEAVAPTCTATGLTEGSHCSVCDEVLTAQVEIPMMEHSYEAVVTEPTCAGEGYTTHTCSVCGNSYNDTYVEALGHAWGESEIATSATCTEDGTKTFSCSRCDATKTEKIDKLGHTVVTDAAVAPTCTATGLTEGSHCSVCNEVLTAQAELPALGHTVVTDTAVAPACTATGLTEGTHCSVCNEVLTTQQIIPAKGHAFGAWQTVTAPNCTNQGGEKRICTACGYAETRNIDATGHSWNSEYTVDKTATCTESGSKSIHCKNCNAVKESAVIPATGHMYQNMVVNPTCTEQGYTTHTCSVCNVSYIDSYINAVGHSWDSGTVTKKPTVTEVGVTTYTCTVCGTTKTEEITKLTNHFEDVDDGDYCAAPVAWAVSKGITNGTSSTTFSPTATCTRGQVVTFLWRAKGSPEPSGTSNPFVDVSSNDYWYRAVLWAVENGITSGTSGNTFSPNDGCTRAQVATFLWRAEGQPDNGGSNPFIDVDAGAYYGKAVLWAVGKNITNGTSANTFAPDMTCTRGQIVTFLYRDMA